MQLQPDAKELLDGVLHAVDPVSFSVSLKSVQPMAYYRTVGDALPCKHGMAVLIPCQQRRRVGGSCLMLYIEVRSTSPQEHSPKLSGDEDRRAGLM